MYATVTYLLLRTGFDTYFVVGIARSSWTVGRFERNLKEMSTQPLADEIAIKIEGQTFNVSRSKTIHVSLRKGKMPPGTGDETWLAEVFAANEPNKTE
jgi:hypothetical protein